MADARVLPGMFDQPIREDFHRIVRSSDPATSVAAAKQQTDERRVYVQERVMDLFHARGPMTDRQLVDAYRERHGQEIPESTIRTRRAELVRDERLEALTTLEGKRPQTVWRISGGTK